MNGESLPALDTFMKQAYEQLAEGRFEEAVETFSASLTLDPNAANALRGRGLAYLQLKRWDGAAEDFRAATQLMPDEADNWIDLGISLGMKNEAYQAIDAFEALLARQPHHVRGHLELGLLYLRIGVIPKGREHLQQALAGRPTLEQRRRIESLLHEQDRLDPKRFYRPDFEALHRQRSASAPGWIRRLLQRFRRSASGR